MNSWKVILATVVIFGTGVLTGGLLVHHIEHLDSSDSPRLTVSENHVLQPASFRDIPRVPTRPPEILSKEFVKRLDQALELSPEKREAIAKIIADGQERNHEIWTNATPQFRKVMQDVRTRIRAELTPDQRKKFEELMKQFRSSKRPGEAPAPATNSVPAPTNAVAPPDA